MHELDEKVVAIVGTDLPWAGSVGLIYKVVGFDDYGTKVGKKSKLSYLPKIKAKSKHEPYGLLFVTLPNFGDNLIVLPIIHKADFYKVYCVFKDEPQIKNILKPSSEMLVTYLPKSHNNGYTTSPLPTLHFVVVPEGTFERYYKLSDILDNPRPELLIDIKYMIKSEDDLKIHLNSSPIV